MTVHQLPLHIMTMFYTTIARVMRVQGNTGHGHLCQLARRWMLSEETNTCSGTRSLTYSYPPACPLLKPTVPRIPLLVRVRFFYKPGSNEIIPLNGSHKFVCPGL